MKRFIRVAMLLCVVTVLLSALSLQTTEAKVHSTSGEGSQGYFNSNVGASRSKSLIGVAAVSASDVWAVGAYLNSHGVPFKTLIEHWNGTQWSVVKSPNHGSGELLGVAAVSASDVWTVGGTASGTLIEHWNGTQWSVVKNPQQGNGILLAVAAVSANDVWAVGDYQNPNGPQQTLIERWNGSKWSIIASPNPSSSYNTLSGVAAVSASDVWAVGGSFDSFGVPIRTLIEHWNGSKWSIIASPNPTFPNFTLSGVAAVSASDVWAVGGSFDSFGVPIRTLIEHWNGRQWSIVMSSNPSVGSGLFGVEAVSASDVWAVGAYPKATTNGEVKKTLIEQWNGSKWSIVKSPNGGSVDVLDGVSAVSTNNVWAVGYVSYIINGHGVEQTLIEQWNGSKWSVVKSPN